jgi:hypothetical protein
MRNNSESGFYNPRIFLAFLLFFGGALLALIGFAARPPLSPLPVSSSNAKGPFFQITGSHLPDGATVATNDNWKDNQQADIQAIGIPPSHDVESAMVRTVIPDAYTVIVRGKNNTGRRWIGGDL